MQLANVEPVRPYVLRITLTDGQTWERNVARHLWGRAFHTARVQFMAGRFDPDLGTIVWPGGADLAPEFLRARPAF